MSVKTGKLLLLDSIALSAYRIYMIWQEFFKEIYKRFISPERFANYLIKLVSIIFIIIILFIIYRLISIGLRRILKKRIGGIHEARAKTVIPLVDSIIRYLFFFITIIAILRELGINYGAILAGAGVVGLAVGFGAQSLIKDIISGFFILFEGLISVGDVITVGDETGVVENIGLRSTQFREFSGLLRTIPNGELTRFGNYNRDFMRALVSIDVDYDSNVEKCIAITEEVAKEWAKQNQEIVLEEPIVQGILNYTTKGTTIRIVVKVKPQTQWDAEWQLRYKIKLAFDKEGIKFPADRRDVHIKKDS